MTLKMSLENAITDLWRDISLGTCERYIWEGPYAFIEIVEFSILHHTFQ